MKKLFIPTLLCAVVMSSCSKNDVDTVLSSNENPNSIGLNVGTSVTKADTETSTLETDGKIVKVLIDDSNTSNSDVTLSFTYSSSSSAWTESNNTQWSSVTFPAYLYSMHDGTADVPVTNTTKNDEKVTADFTVVDTDVADQQDLVYYGGKLSAQPTNSKITAVFKHALSKVMIQAKASKSTGVKYYISYVKLVNLEGTATSTITVSDAGAASIDWSGFGTPQTYGYFSNSALSTAILLTSTAASAVGTANMYVIPQTAVAVTKADIEAKHGTSSTDITSEYVEVVYYSTDADGLPIIGFPTADANPHYDSSTMSVGAKDPLFVKAAFPLSYTFDDANYYNLILDFDGDNILNVEKKFVDEDGDPIDEDFDNNPEPGDPVNPDSGVAIGLSVVVNADWDNSTPTPTTLGNK